MKRRHIFPVLIVLLGIALIAYLWISQNTVRALMSVLIAVVTGFFLLLWFAFFSRARRRVRVLGTLLVFSAVGVLAALFKYEGTGSGHALPTFSFRWNTPPALAPVPTTATPLAAPTKVELPDGLAPVGFLGPARDGIIPGVTLDPDWETNPPREVWRRPVGKAWSSFAVVGHRAITQEQREAQEMVVCYHALTGEPLWGTGEELLWSEPMGGDGPRATPVVVDDKVYALGGSGMLLCLDLETGKKQWAVNTLNDDKPLLYGQSSAPLIVDNLVVVPGGENSEFALQAFNAENGESVWKAGNGVASYSSPVILDIEGKRQIVAVHNTNISGHDIATGKILWEHPWPGDMFPNACQPIQVAPNQLLVTAAYDQDSMLLEFKDGKTTEIWKKNRMKTKFSSAVVKDGYAYGASDGFFSCIDVTTGDRKWKGGRYGFGQQVLAGDILVIQAEKGDLVLLAADPSERRELAKIKALSSKTWNIPALVSRYVYLRNDREAVCYELPGTVSSSE